KILPRLAVHAQRRDAQPQAGEVFYRFDRPVGRKLAGAPIAGADDAKSGPFGDLVHEGGTHFAVVDRVEVVEVPDKVREGFDSREGVIAVQGADRLQNDVVGTDPKPFDQMLPTASHAAVSDLEGHLPAGALGNGFGKTDRGVVPDGARRVDIGRMQHSFLKFRGSGEAGHAEACHGQGSDREAFLHFFSPPVVGFALPLLLVKAPDSTISAGDWGCSRKILAAFHKKVSSCQGAREVDDVFELCETQAVDGRAARPSSSHFLLTAKASRFSSCPHSAALRLSLRGA